MFFDTTALDFPFLIGMFDSRRKGRGDKPRPKTEKIPYHGLCFDKCGHESSNFNSQKKLSGV